MDISIIIVNYKSKDKLISCLDSISKSNLTSLSYEIIVVENNSGDDLSDISYPNLKIIISPDNLGMGGGNNLGLKDSGGEFILISNPDIIFESNTSRRIDGDIETALYRAIIECINNTLKYAHAGMIHIQLTDTGSQIQLKYSDNGLGFDITKTIAEHKGLGLFNLQNRLHTIGGKVDLKSEPGKGVDYLFTVNI